MSPVFILTGRRAVVFPGNPLFNRPVPNDGNYWVLSTDYVNYSVVWSCETFNGKSFRKSLTTLG